LNERFDSPRSMSPGAISLFLLVAIEGYFILAM
jgi:hypothetical protein